MQHSYKVAKIFKEKVTSDESVFNNKLQKLRFMVSHPPRGKALDFIAWPEGILFSSLKEEGILSGFVGFTMKRIDMSKFVNIDDVLSTDNRVSMVKDKQWSNFREWKSLYIVAINFASILLALHQSDYIMGDISPQNVYVNGDGEIALVDCDSFRRMDSNDDLGALGVPGFTSPERLKKGLRGSVSESQERFSLAVMLFKILMLNNRPFWLTEETPDVKTEDDYVKEGRSPYFGNGSLLPPYAVRPFVLPRGLLKLFRQAFMDGYYYPLRRPTSEEWYKALKENYEKNKLKTCDNNTNHSYFKEDGKGCPWCRMTSSAGWKYGDPFPVYDITIRVSAIGLPKSASWTATFNGKEIEAKGKDLIIYSKQGKHHLVINPIKIKDLDFQVEGNQEIISEFLFSDVNKEIVFKTDKKVMDNLQMIFRQEGLPSGTKWSVSLYSKDRFIEQETREDTITIHDREYLIENLGEEITLRVPEVHTDKGNLGVNYESNYEATITFALHKYLFTLYFKDIRKQYSLWYLPNLMEAIVSAGQNTLSFIATALWMVLPYIFVGLFVIGFLFYGTIFSRNYLYFYSSILVVGSYFSFHKWPIDDARLHFIIRTSLTIAPALSYVVIGVIVGHFSPGIILISDLLLVGFLLFLPLFRNIISHEWPGYDRIIATVIITISILTSFVIFRYL